MRNSQVQILNAVNTASQTGAALDVNQIVAASFSVINNDVTAAGTVKLQCSNQLVTNGSRQTFLPTEWVDIPNATATVASGVAPAIVIGQMCFSYIRAVYTRTAGGSSTITVSANCLSV